MRRLQKRVERREERALMRQILSWAGHASFVMQLLNHIARKFVRDSYGNTHQAGRCPGHQLAPAGTRV